MSQNFGLPRSVRLSDDEVIRALYGHAASVRGRWLTLRWSSNSVGFARLLIRVAKHLQRRAVERNQLRRSIRESFRLRRLGLPAMDYLVSLRAPGAAGAAKQVRTEFERLLTLAK